MGGFPHGCRAVDTYDSRTFVKKMVDNSDSNLFDPHLLPYINMCMNYSTMYVLLTDCKYEIKARIGDQDNAFTDATVYIRLYGSQATCGWVSLATPRNDFQRGK